MERSILFLKKVVDIHDFYVTLGWVGRKQTTHVRTMSCLRCTFTSTLGVLR